MTTTEYEISYHTHNTYESPVTEALFAFLVAPCQDYSQSVRNLSFRNSLGEEMFQHQNPFRFNVHCVRSVKRFTDFEFWMQATVDKKPHNFLQENMLSAEEEQARLTSRDFFIDHHIYLGAARYTTIDSFLSHRVLRRQEGQQIYDYLVQLNAYIYSMLEFDPEPTHVLTSASEAMELGRGVCQDYTHLFIGIARQNQIPCRYVSGYLNQGGGLVGSSQMHAWVEAYIPDSGWRGFDPTNNLLADENYIKTSHGTDYSDCSPIKGVLKTSGGHKTTYGVKVTQNQMEQESQ